MRCAGHVRPARGASAIALTKLEKTRTRQVCFFRGKADPQAANVIERMKRAIDSERGRQLYGGRFATVEPVFGNIRHNKWDKGPGSN